MSEGPILTNHALAIFREWARADEDLRLGPGDEDYSVDDVLDRCIAALGAAQRRIELLRVMAGSRARSPGAPPS